MYKVLKVSRSGYYKWCHHKPSTSEIKRRNIAFVAAGFHAKSNGIYGYRKVLEDIQEDAPELVCAPETLRLIMKSEHLFSCVKPKWRKPDLGNKCFYKYADNELDRDFTATAPNQNGWLISPTFVQSRVGFI